MNFVTKSTSMEMHINKLVLSLRIVNLIQISYRLEKSKINLEMKLSLVLVFTMCRGAIMNYYSQQPILNICDPSPVDVPLPSDNDLTTMSLAVKTYKICLNAVGYLLDFGK